MGNLEKYSDQAALVGRLFYSSMFLLFGYGKLTAFAGTAEYMGSLGLPAPALVTGLAIIIEIGAGLLMLVGYQTRLVALGLGIYVLITAFIGHSQLVLHRANRRHRRKRRTPASRPQSLPAEFGNWNSIWKRFWWLSRSGVFEAFLQLLAETSKTAHVVQFFDSTVVRAHVSAAGAKGGRPSAVRGAGSPRKSTSRQTLTACPLPSI